MGRNRTNAIYFMISDQEEALLAQRCSDCGMTRSKYLRHLISDVQPKVIPAVNDDTHYQLMKIGNNLNQIARRLNSGEAVLHSEVSDALTDLRSVIADIRREMTGGSRL